MLPVTPRILATLALIGVGVAAFWVRSAVADPPADTLPLELPRDPPYGLSALPAPAADDDQVRLGRRLFFDPILSVDRTVSCASCHRPDHGFADPTPRSAGVEGRSTLRHAPTLLNRAWGESFMWDGAFTALEEQVLQPIANELEMALPLPDAVSRLRDDPDYATEFSRVFGGAPSNEHLGQALASFVRRLYHGDSAVDRFQGGDFAALTDAERAGLWLFESRGKCWQCHSGANFTDEDFHNTGVGVIDGEPELGRAAATGDDADRGAFKTPTLRGLPATAPYMHDGSLATLEEVVDFYRQGGRPNSHLDPRVEPIEMSDRDRANLAAFLRALSRANTATTDRKPER